MDNKAMALTVNTFDDLLNMNADMHDSIRRLTVKYADCKSSIRHVCDVLTALHRLEWLEIQNPDGRFCTINGILYSRNGKSLYFCPREREGSVRVQEGTAVICKNAFSATNISELIIPDSVKRIQEFACGDNHVLEKVIGGKGIVSFGQYAFFNCVKLTEFRIPALNPKSYATLIANKINAMINKSSEDEALTPPELYQYSTDSTGLTAALEQCRKYPNGNLRRFITRNIRVIFANLIIAPLNDSGEEIMVSLIKDGVFTDVALKKILEEIEKTGERRNLTTLKAYVLDTIGKSTDTFQI